MEVTDEVINIIREEVLAQTEQKGFLFLLVNHEGSAHPNKSFALLGRNWPMRHVLLQSHVAGVVAVFYRATC